MVAQTMKRQRRGTQPTSTSQFKRRRTNAKPITKRSVDTGHVDLAVANYACDTTGSITLLTTIPQNASQNGRIGKKVMLRSLQCRGVLNGNAAVTKTDVAYLIVYDKRPNGLPAITEILDSIDAGSLNNDDNTSRFTILKRVDDVLVGSVANQLTPSSMKNADWFLPINRIQTYNSLGTGAILDIQEGALYLVTVGGSAAGTAAGQLTVRFRTRFEDI